MVKQLNALFAWAEAVLALAIPKAEIAYVKAIHYD